MTLITIRCWANVANGGSLSMLAQRWQTNQSPQMVGKLLANGWITKLTPMLDHCRNNDHKKIDLFSELLGMVGKGLANQRHDANLIPMLGQRWNSDHLLLFPKIGLQMVGNWPDSQCLMLRLAQCWLANQ